jgi:hypothetical protein
MRFPFQSKLLVGTSCACPRVTCLSAKSGRIALMLWLLWALPAVCHPSEPQTTRPLRQVATSALSDRGAAIADLDGDRHPDLAIVRPEGWGPRGVQYQIEFDLSTRVASDPLTVTADRGGLRIAARDVDGDGDLDLVVKNSWSLVPVGVWINDGHGRFTKGDPTAYPISVLTEGPGILSDTPEQTLQPALPQSHRFCLDLFPSSYFHNELTFEYPPLPSAGAQRFEKAMTHPSTRAPPPPFPQHST